MTSRDDQVPTRRRRDAFVELADAIERAWLRRWGSVPVVARVVIERIRRGNP